MIFALNLQQYLNEGIGIPLMFINDLIEFIFSHRRYFPFSFSFALGRSKPLLATIEPD